jgi:hypothetical protein
MVEVITSDELCVIRHKQYLYSFNKTFLSEKLWKGLRLLPAFRKSRGVFPLNSKEANKLDLLFEKIITEKHSDYIYSEDLQRVYLVELVHFINKLCMNDI